MKVATVSLVNSANEHYARPIVLSTVQEKDTYLTLDDARTLVEDLTRAIGLVLQVEAQGQPYRPRASRMEGTD